MKYNVSAGHNPQGMIASGAVGYLEESVENRIIKDLVIEKLRYLGHVVYDCTCDNGASQNDVLNKIVAKCNSNDVDLDISIHLNWFYGKGNGVECITYSDGLFNSVANNYARQIVNSIAELGFKNRGVKYNASLKYLRETKASAVLIECCFCDSKIDFDIYDAEKMAEAIVKGITGIVVKAPKDENKSDVPFEFVVKTDLNYRTGPGIEYDKKGTIKDRLKYTIVETAKAKDGGTWGKLKSGDYWLNISDKYIQRV